FGVQPKCVHTLFSAKISCCPLYSVFTIHTPNCALNRSSTCPGGNLSGVPTLNLLGGSRKIFGNMNRTVPSVQAAAVADRAVKPSASADIPNKNARRSAAASFAAFAAPGFAYAGFTGIGGTTIASFAFAFFASAATGEAFACASAFVIGPGLTSLRAAARMLCVSTGSAFAGAASFFAGAAFAAAGFGAGFSFGAAGTAPACFSPRAVANISATLGRPPAPGFVDGGALGFAAGAFGFSAAASFGAASAGGVSAAPPCASAFRAAAKISATDIFL